MELVNRRKERKVMKEWLKSITSWIGVNKKRSIVGIALTAVLLAGISGTAVAAGKTKNDVSVAKIASVARVTEGNEEQAEQEKKEGTEKKEEKKEGQTDQDKNKKSGEADSTVSNKTAAASEKTGSSGASTQKQTTDSSKASSSTASTGSSGNSGGSGSSPQGTAGNSAPSSSAGESSSGSTQPSQPAPEPAQPAPEPTQPTEPTQPSEPVHVHDWQPQYTAGQEWVDTSYVDIKEIMRCSICHENITDNAGVHLEAHALAGEGVGSAYSDIDEELVEDGYWAPTQELTGYACACGATK